MRSAAAWLLGLTLVLTAVVVGGWLVLAHTGALKPAARYLLERYAGLELTVAGPLSLTPALQPEVVLGDVRLRHPGWTGADLFAAEQVRFRVDLPALLHGRLDLLMLEIAGAALHLEETDSGATSWGSRDRAGSGGDALQLNVREAKVTDTRVLVRMPGRAERQLEIGELAARAGTDGMLTLTGHGVFDRQSWGITGRAGTLEALLRGRNVALDVSVAVGAARVAIVGEIGDLATLGDVELDLTVPRLPASALAGLIGIRAVPEANVELGATVRPDPQGAAVTVHGQAADVTFAAAGTIGDLRSLDDVRGEFTLSGADAASLQVGLAGPFEVRGHGSRSGSRLRLNDVAATFADARLELEAMLTGSPQLDAGTVKLTLSGSDLSRFEQALGTHDLPAASYRLDAEVRLPERSFTAMLDVAQHRLTAAGTLGEGLELTGSEVSLRASGERLGELCRLLGLGDEISGRYAAAANVAVHATEITVSDLEVDTAPIQLAGDATLSRRGVHDLRADLTIRLPALRSTGALFGVDGLPDHGIRGAVSLARRQGTWRLNPSRVDAEDCTVQAQGVLGKLHEPAQVDVAVHAEGGSLSRCLGRELPLRLGDRPFQLETGLRLASRHVDLDDLQLRTAGSLVRLDGRVPFVQGPVGTDLAVSTEGDDLAAVFPSVDDYQPPNRPFRVVGRVAMVDPGIWLLDAVDLAVGEARVRANGGISLSERAVVDLSIVASGPTLAELGSFRELALPTPFQLDARLSSTRHDLELRHFHAVLGDSDASGSGRLDWSGDVPMVTLKASAGQIRLPAHIEESLAGSPPPADKWFSTAPLPFERLRDIQGGVELAVDTLSGLGDTRRNVILVARLQQGELALERLEFQDRSGTFAASGTVRALDEGAALSFALRGSGLDIALLTSVEQPPETVPRYDIEAHLSSRGGSQAQLMAAMSGSVLVTSGTGKIDNRRFEALGGDFFDTAFRTLNPFARTSRFTDLECAVLNTRIDGGVVDLVPGLVIRSAALNMFVLGQLDLSTETLDLSLVTQPRRGMGIAPGSVLNPYFKIGGKFTKPRLQVDPTSASLAQTAAMATFGLSNVARGWWARIRGGRNPCDAFIAQWSTP